MSEKESTQAHICRLLLVVCSLALAASSGYAAMEAGDSRLARIIDRGMGQTSALRLEGELLPVHGEGFRIIWDGAPHTLQDFNLLSVQREDSGAAVLHLRHEALDIELSFWLSEHGFFRKQMRLLARKNLTLERVDVESLAFAGAPKTTIARSVKLANYYSGLPICAFVEFAKVGAFLSLDFAYSEIEVEGGSLRIGYQPHRRLQRGEAYLTHSVTVGSFPLAGTRQGPYDRNAAAEFRRYIRFDYAPPHVKGPQLIYTSIVNRFTEVDRSVPATPLGGTPLQNTIFYTLSDANYYMLHPERMPAEIDFCKSLNMDVCQVYEGPFEWIAGNPAAALLRRIGDYARGRGVKLGLYTGANHLVAPHFNHYGQDKGRPEWRMLGADGKRGPYCWGSDAFSRWFTDVLIEASLNFNFHHANFDFLEIYPCFDVSHGHAEGENGVYRQVFNLVRSLDTVRAAVPGYSYDSNLGWPPLVPKIAPSMDGFYLNDPHFLTFFPTLNSTESLDHSRRAEMVSYYLNYLTPVEYFRNCEYFVAADSVLHDRQMLEFGILQGLAVTPNLQLGESRALFDRLSPSEQRQARRFITRWTAFAKDYWDYYANTLLLSGPPQLGQVETYAHSKGDRSVVFLVNPNPFPKKASLRLDDSIGLSGKGPYWLKELYPEDRWVSGSAGFDTRRGELYESVVPAHTVRVLDAQPRPAYGQEPFRVAGVPAIYDEFEDHFHVTVDGWQGERRQAEFYLPDERVLSRVETKGKRLLVSRIPGGYAVDLSFPKEAVQSDLLWWSVQPMSLAGGLQAGLAGAPAGQRRVEFPVLDSASPAANFLGARVENLLNERFPVELDVYFEPGALDEPASEKTRLTPPAGPVGSMADLLPDGDAGAEWWYTTRFDLAYVQRFVPPAPDEHNYIALNFQRPGDVVEVRAWLNGEEVHVDSFRPWRAPDWARTYYVNGTRGGLRRGSNLLATFVRYRAETNSRSQ